MMLWLKYPYGWTRNPSMLASNVIRSININLFFKSK